MISYISDIIYLSSNIELDITLSENIYIQILPFIKNISEYKLVYNDYLDNLIIKILDIISNCTIRPIINNIISSEKSNIFDNINKLMNDKKQIIVLDIDIAQFYQSNNNNKYCNDCCLLLNIISFILLQNKVNIIYILRYYHINKEEINFYKIINIINDICPEKIEINYLFKLRDIMTSNLSNLINDIKKIIDRQLNYNELIIQSINILKKITKIQEETNELIKFLLLEIINKNNINYISNKEFIKVIKFIIKIYNYKVYESNSFIAPYNYTSNDILVCEENNLINSIKKRLKINFQSIIIKNDQQYKITKNTLHSSNQKQDINQIPMPDLYNLKLYIDSPDIFYKQYFLQIENEHRYNYSLKGNVIKIIKYYNSLSEDISYISKLKSIIKEIKNNLFIIKINIFLYKVYKIKIFFLLQQYFKLIDAKNKFINYQPHSIIWDKLLISNKYNIVNKNKSLDIVIYTTNIKKKSNFLLPYFFYSTENTEINNIIIYEISNKDVKRETYIINDKIIDKFNYLKEKIIELVGDEGLKPPTSSV